MRPRIATASNRLSGFAAKVLPARMLRHIGLRLIMNATGDEQQ